MAIALVESFGEALRQNPLLEPAQLSELPALEVRFPEPRALAGELIQRDWLTPYQVNQLFQGRGQELILGQYLLLERLGEGGMGQVFKARHRSLGRIVALKVIRKDRLANPTALRRFQREIQVVAQLAHPNVVLAFDAAEVNGRHFFAMEYVEGIDLARLVADKGPLPIEQACDYARQTALGLQHAHERGMVHRDIKPSNLLVSRGKKPSSNPALPAPSPWGVVKILDMGLARLDRPEDMALATLLTQEGLVIGTPDFLAPEQARNSHTIDIRADLYSLGCTLYFLLSGRVPFLGGSFTEKVIQHQLDEAPRVELLRPEVPPLLAAVVRRLMAKQPDERYQTPAEVAAALAGLSSDLDFEFDVSMAPTPLDPMEDDNEWVPIELLTPLEAPRFPSGSSKPNPRPEDFAISSTATSEGLIVAPRVKKARRRGRRLRVAVGAGVFVLGALVLAAGLSKPESDLNSKPQALTKKPSAREDPIQAELQRLVADAKKSPPEAGGLREKLLDFRRRHCGTKPAQQAAKVLLQLPSPLDRLHPTTREERFVRRPRELVAVLGKRRAPAQGNGVEPLWKAMRAVAFSPDGKHLASGGIDNFVRFWDPVPKRWPILGTGHTGHVLAATYSPDGKLLATASEDGTVKLWDAGTAQERSTLDSHRSQVVALAFTADGTTLASACRDGTVKLWDPVACKERTSLRGPAGRLLSVAWAPDGKTLACGCANHAVQMWDVTRRKQAPPVSYRWHTSWVLVTAFSPDGQTFVSGGGGNGAMRLWSRNGPSFTHHAFLHGHNHIVHGVAFAPDGKSLVSAGHDGRVIFWETATGKKLRDWKLPAPVFGVAFSWDGRHLATANAHGTLFIYRLADPALDRDSARHN